VWEHDQQEGAHHHDGVRRDRGVDLEDDTTAVLAGAWDEDAGLGPRFSWEIPDRVVTAAMTAMFVATVVRS
jgi:hypothetical protein